VATDSSSTDPEQPHWCSGGPTASGPKAHQDGGVPRRFRSSDVNRSQSDCSPGKTSRPASSLGSGSAASRPAVLFRGLQGRAAETSRGFQAQGSIGRRSGGNARPSQRTWLWSKTLRSATPQRQPTLCGNARNLEVEAGRNGERVPAAVTRYSCNRGKSSEGYGAIGESVEARTPACRRKSLGLETWRTP
jgi:hypothetical protein